MMKSLLKVLLITIFLFLSYNSKAQTLQQAKSFLENSDYDNAIQSFTEIKKKAIQTKNTSLLVTTQNGIADCYLDLGAYYKAMSILKENIKTLKNQKKQDNVLLAETHYLLSICFDKLNMPEDYLRECNNFYRYYQKAFPDKKIYKALYYASIGRYYNLRLLIDKAYQYTDAALKIYHNNKNEAHLVDEYIFYNAHLFSLRFYDTSFEYRKSYQDSLIYSLNKRYPYDNVKKSRIFISIAAINLDVANNLWDDDFRLENANIAIEWYKKALKINESKIGFYHPESGRLNSLKGLMLLFKKDYKAALENFETGIKKISYNDTNLKYPFTYNHSLLMGLLRYKAMCLNDMYKENKDFKLVYEIEKTLLTMEKVWADYADNTFKNKQSYNSNGYVFSPHSDLIAVYYNLFKETGKTAYLNNFFEYDEKSKYTALLESLHKEINAVNEQKSNAKNRIETYESFDDVMLSYNRKTTLKNTKKENENIFKENLDKFNNQESNIINSKKVISLKEHQENLKENEAFLSINYFREGLKNKKTPYILLITKKTSKIILLNSDNDFTKFKVDELLGPLNNNDIQSYKKIAYEYYLNYFKPIETFLPKSVNHIKISPDSNFSNLPFDLLLNSDTKSNDFRKLPYLIKKYQFSYSFSSTIESFVNQSSDNKGSFSVFSPDFSDKKLTHLNLAKNTAATISEKYNAKLMDAGTASKSNFEKHLLEDKVIAILSHGKSDSNDDDETNRGIYLSDGFLNLKEVYNYKSKTDFLLLGACETGVGHKENNEGNINLARAFTSIGVKSMLLSSWKIDESSSMKIINSFLNYLNNGDTKSAALQKAKLDYLATAHPRKASPLFWAGLNITGNNETIKLNKTNYYWYALGLIPIFFGYWYFRKKSKNKNNLV